MSEERNSTPAASAAERLAEKLRSLPQEPGVYLMKDAQDTVFYVGKAINLRARVRSYFNGGDERAFVGLLDQELADLEIVVVRDEREALLLENRLIKQHQPRYNVQLRDDKTYVSLRLDLRAANGDLPQAEVAAAARFPRLEVTRRVRDDGARYFGPYIGAAAVRETLRLLNRHFGLRTCSDRTFAARRRPCIIHQMGRCLGPCALSIDPDLYYARAQDVVLLLSGHYEELLQGLQQRMSQASESLEYERAAKLRDQIRAVERVVHTVTPGKGKLIERMAIGYQREGNLLAVAFMPVAQGIPSRPRTYTFTDLRAPDDELLASLLTQSLADRDDAELPDELLLPFTVADQQALVTWLAQRRRNAHKRQMQLRVPQRGEAHSLLLLAQRNAQEALAELSRSRRNRDQALLGLSRLLHLAKAPRSIECFDVSTFQGGHSVAAKVLFVDAEPQRSGYRRYIIKNVSAQDDFAMLYEALSRRLRRGLAEHDLPDMLLVDGGKGQLAVAEAACADLDVHNVILAGIAKARVLAADAPVTADATVEHSAERLFVPGRKNPIILRQHSAERALVERIRDETHRFAITFHRQRRARQTIRSQLDSIVGIGPKLRGRLLRRFGSVAGVRTASLAQLQEVEGVSATLAVRILECLTN